MARTCHLCPSPPQPLETSLLLHLEPEILSSPPVCAPNYAELQVHQSPLGFFPSRNWNVYLGSLCLPSVRAIDHYSFSLAIHKVIYMV